MPETPPIRLRLAEVRLERFKAAFKTTKPITFRPFNVIIGRNGAGKSTVLEALQWIDTALRSDVIQACRRYNGVHDVINHQATGSERHFKVSLKWACDSEEGSTVDYSLRIGEADDHRTPVIANEELSLSLQSDQPNLIITTDKGVRTLRSMRKKEPVPFTYREKLLLGTALARDATDSTVPYLLALGKFWSEAVFLRLTPSELAMSGAPSRPSYAPLLDESGSTLPALLSELSRAQRVELIHAIQRALPDFSEVDVSQPIIPKGEVYYSLTEMMPSRGRTGRKKVAIPAVMLSEGTRRITAILSLLQHEPPPTFLCIEEIENGLDPWNVKAVLRELQSASDRGVQVAVTTHSPWLLDHVKVADIIHVERQEGKTIYSQFADSEAVKAYQGRVPPGAIYATEG
ncbi:MAG: AAA family ATPase [Isosphaeraceae bacterium]|jgi:predicted ATPase